jgi:hypothetical protein
MRKTGKVLSYLSAQADEIEMTMLRRFPVIAFLTFFSRDNSLSLVPASVPRQLLLECSCHAVIKPLNDRATIFVAIPLANAG